MEFTQLGRTGLKVSRFCLGTMNFGPETDEGDSFVIMDKALELGINFFDTANVYGWKIGEGITENIVGRWFAQGGGRRESTVLATKVFGRMGEWPNESRLSALHIRRACEASLKRLRTDHIDLYQMHHVDRFTPWEEIWQAMEVLVQQGKVLYVGSSNFAGWHIAKAQEAAKTRHFMGLTSEQSLKTGRRTNDAMKKKINEKRSQLIAWEKLCKKLGEQPADVALAWLLLNPVVTAPIIGPRTIEQLTGSLRAFKIKLNKDALAQIDKIWPGPGGEAPEAYAW
jgi:aryl-alcohol dehydrogenase-like predicted oxidoreductase